MLGIDINNDNNSLRAKVFSRIQNDILNGVYQPGDSLTEKKLCEELGVSRTPVREALRQLELEELVQSTPNKGVVVTGVTSKDIEEIYIIRMMIEGLAARWATEHITPEEIQELKDALDLEEFYTMKKDADHILKIDSKFHDILFRASKSKPLMHMLRTFHHYVQRARNASFESPDRAKKVLEEHKAIFDAVVEGDADKAERVTKEHVKNASIAYKKLIQDNKV
ncbi:MAG TPA: GntR family transcriptional regulator [Acetivibrio sp.]|jgi:DNA-binding GntR family transcriptional regulator|nr:GntR family transcriptional regulator [Clostridium sp.]HOQ38006.1 GntR family transcriptional regulator [Acetivibrio sp.]HPT90573.1 GntR family transcriptional regulator [Acetivibrio sp.]HQA56786.1 GntR family transcriptional regulator [Acetivibrio sp.]